MKEMLIREWKKTPADMNVVLIWLVGFSECSVVNQAILSNGFISGETAFNNMYWFITGIFSLTIMLTSKETWVNKIVICCLAFVFCFLIVNYLGK